MQEANGQQLDKNPPIAGKDEVVSKISKFDEESSTNIVKCHLDSYLRATRGSTELTS